MANTANVTWDTSGPAFSFQQVAFGGKDAAQMAYHGYLSFTGDGSSASVTVNWIDGTQTPFSTPGNPPTAVAPKFVIAGQLNTASTTAVFVENVNTISTTGCVLTLSGAAPAVATILPILVFPF